MIFLCQLHAAVVQDLGPLACQLQHLVIGDLQELFRVWDNTGVGGVYAVYIGVNLAQVRMEGGGQRHGAGVGPAAAQRGHIAHPVDPLEPRHQDNLVLVQLPLDALGVDLLDPRVTVGTAGVDAHLPSSQAHHREPHPLQRHGAQGDGDLLTGAQEHIHLPLGGVGVDLLCPFNEVVSGVPLGGQDHQHLVTGSISISDNPRYILDALGIPDGAAAEFLYNQLHVGYSPLWKMSGTREGWFCRHFPL